MQRVQGESSSDFVVYHWGGYDRFLVRTVLPRATPIPAWTDDDADAIAARVPENARAFLFHINLSVSTRLPRRRDGLVRALTRRGITPLNAHFTDMTKRALQSACERLDIPTTRAARHGEPSELLIVKTNHNCGGRQERTLRRGRRRLLGIERPSLTITSTRSYRVLERRNVAAAWWADTSLVVERYIANARDRFYRAYVLGERVVLSEVINPRVIKKMDPGLWRRNHVLDLREGAGATDESATVPAELRALVAKAIRGFGLDYGTVDVLEDAAARFHVIDLNATPYWGKESQDDLTAYLTIP